jgi:uncharacterized protein YjiS (DUF1127 family)
MVLPFVVNPAKTHGKAKRMRPMSLFVVCQVPRRRFDTHSKRFWMSTSMASNPTLQNARTTSFNQFAAASSGRMLRDLCAPLIQWWRVSEERHRLGHLDDRLLCDAGFDPQEARREAQKPFWSAFTLVQKREKQR